MSDMTLIAEDIVQTMHAIDEAHKVAEDLRKKNDHAAFDVFRAKMDELHDRLSRLKLILDNEEAYAMDELMNAMSKAYSSHGAEYRKTQHMTG